MIEKMQAKETRLTSHTPETEKTLVAGKDSKPEKEIELKIPEIELPKIGRNDTVVISKNGETRELKFKKAEPLIRDEGWKLEKW